MSVSVGVLVVCVLLLCWMGLSICVILALIPCLYIHLYFEFLLLD